MASRVPGRSVGPVIAGPARTRVTRLIAALGAAALFAGCGTSGAPPAPTAAPQPTPTIRAYVARPIPGTYVALGASETFGIGAQPITDGYAYLLSRRLHARHFIDAGIPGATLSQGYNAELAQALNARAALCTLFFGTNDLRAGIPRNDFLSDLRDFIVTLRRSGARVLVIGLPDIAELPAVKKLHMPDVVGIVRSWNQGMASVSRETGATFLDLGPFGHELAKHPEYIASDGLHPSNAGHRRIAQLVLQTIRARHLWNT
jgi:lysophospholipase L1-like esterase